MSRRLHPFEVYRLFLYTHFHLTTDWFHLGKTELGLSVGKFEANRNARVFEQVAASYDETELEDAFVSNLLEDPSRHITAFLSKGRSLAIRDQWYDRVKNIDRIFGYQLDSFIREWSLASPKELQDTLFVAGGKRLTVDSRKISDLREAVDDEDFDFSFTDNMKLRSLKDAPMEFLALLDEVFLLKTKRSFLHEQWKSSPAAFESFLRAFKYKELLPLEELVKGDNVSSLLENI